MIMQQHAGKEKLDIIPSGTMILEHDVPPTICVQELPGSQVTIFAEKFGTDTTTAGAAGIWGPYVSVG